MLGSCMLHMANVIYVNQYAQIAQPCKTRRHP